jgi:vitamin B12 transporter
MLSYFNLRWSSIQPDWRCFWLGLLLCGYPGRVVGDTTAVDTAWYQLPPTIITAHRYQQSLQSVPENTATVTQEHLRHTPAHNLLEGLNFTPGLIVRKTGGVGTREQVSIQGSEPRQVAILFDGIPLNTISEGDADLAPFPIEQVGRVEIVKGPASSAWGSTLGGVIQVLSPELVPGQPTRYRAGLSYGRWGTHQEQFSLQGGGKSLGYLLAASHLSTEGFRPRSAHDGYQVFAKAERPWSQGRLGVSVGTLEGETEDFVQFGQPLWKQHEYTTRYGQLYYQGPVFESWDARLQVFGISRDLEVRFWGLEDDQLVSQVAFDEPAWGSALQLAGPATAYGRGAGGIDWRIWQADFRFQGGPPGKRFYEEGIYGNWSQPWQELAINTGLRYDHHSLYGTQWSPSVGLVYNFEPARTLLRVQWSRGFGAPPLGAAFLPETAQTAPNPDLKAERATAYHAGIETQLGKAAVLQATWFHSDVEDAVDTALNDRGKFIQKNFERQKRQGAELTGQLTWAWGLGVMGGMAFNQVKSKDKDEIINGTARQTRDLVVQYSRQKFNLWLGGHYAEYDIVEVLRKPPLSFTAQDGRFLWDMRISHDLPPWAGVQAALHLVVYNLLDTEFWWLTPYPLPGRAFEVGLRLESGG